MDIQVVNVPEHSRYEARVDGVVAGFSAYKRREGTIAFTHTVVQPEFEGKGVGSAMARGALDDVRASGGAVIPLCPFIAAYIRSHEDYLDLIDPSYLPDFDATTAG